MIGLIRAYFDGLSELRAERLLRADRDVIDIWRIAVAENVKARRGRWADVAYLKRQRTRKYA